MPYPAKAIANYFLDRSWAENSPVDPLKLQKMLYYAHGWHLGLYGAPLLDEQIQAWKYGPVVPSVYREFKECGNEPIEWPARQAGSRHVPRVSGNDDETRAFLDRIWDVYSKFNGLRLSDMTHKTGTPWATVWERSQRDIAIPNRLIESYFRQMVGPDNSRAIPRETKA